MDTKANIITSCRLTDFRQVNEEFTCCRCSVFYTGRNRNYSDITPEAVQRFIEHKGYANVPVVAHLIKDGDTYKVGGHDIQLTENGQNLEIESLTVPFGVIPENCNPAMENITDEYGVTKRYFCCDLLLWTHRYPILKAAYSDKVYFNQSMEAVFHRVKRDGDYIIVDAFSLSALCLLNKSDGEDNVEPCFEQSQVTALFSENNRLKSDFDELLSRYNNFAKGGAGRMKEKLLKALEKETYLNPAGEQHARYALISVVGDDKAGVFDRSDVQCYTVPFTVNDEGEAVLNFDEKEKCGLATCPEADEVFDLKGEFEYTAITASKKRENELTDGISKRIAEYEKKDAARAAEFEAVKTEYKKISARLDKYVKADEKLRQEQHIKAVDELVRSYGSDFEINGGTAEYFAYAADPKIYSKTTKQIEDDLIFMLGKAKHENSDSPLVGLCSVQYSLKDKKVPENNDRYGSLFKNIEN